MNSKDKLIQRWSKTNNGAVNQETYNDYPKSASNNAQKAIDWRDEHGREEVSGGTAVGWKRASQLSKGENISRETIGRMAAFKRHEKNSKVDEVCGIQRHPGYRLPTRPT